MFDFREKFKDRPTIELQQMLEQPQKYQPDAIEAAKTIIAFRREHEPESFGKDVAIFSKEKEPSTISTGQNVPAEHTTDIWEEDETDRSKKAVTRNHILSIILVYVVINGIHLFDLIQIGMNNDLTDVKLTDWALTFAPLAFTIVGIIFFLKREKAGWILLVFDFTYRLIFNIQLLILSIRYISNPLIPFPIYNTLLPSVLFGLVLYRLGSARLMAQYKVTGQTFLFTVGASIIFAACIVFAQRFI